MNYLANTYSATVVLDIKCLSDGSGYAYIIPNVNIKQQIPMGPVENYDVTKMLETWLQAKNEPTKWGEEETWN
jgi:hypothetical protein